MIPYVEIRGKTDYKTLAIIEPQECWLELSYQDVGKFEIYCRASKGNLQALQKGRFVTIPNKPYIWFITSVRYTFTAAGSRMISATGYEAKWLLNKRCILSPKELSGTITSAVYGLVSANMGAALDDTNPRKIKGFVVDTNNVNDSVNGAQAPRGNLLEFVTTLLKAHGCGHIATFANGAIKYTIFKGEDKTKSVRFSQSLDNLLSSEYLTDDTNIANYALVVSTFDETTTDANGVEQKHKADYTKEINKGATGIDRAEIIVESNLSTKYEDANGTEQETTPTSDLYQSWQEAEGKNNLAEHITIEEINGEMDIVNSNYTFADDFFLGDLVGAQDEYFNFLANTRISKYTFKQDANGYGEEAEYGGKQ